MTNDEYFRRLSEQLTRDIGRLVEDANYREAGGEILLAVDFSEIFAYCVSSANSFLHSRIAAREEYGPNVLEALHNSIMMYYMFDASQELWLLDPYLVEFINFKKALSGRYFRDAMGRFGDALRKGLTLEDDPRFAELKEMVARIGPRRVASTDHLRRRVVELFEELAPEIVALRSDKFRSAPAERVRALETAGRLVVPSGLPDNVSNGDGEVEKRWRKALAAVRPQRKSQNISDAQAMSALYSINRWLQARPSRRRLVLLTRSDAMHAVMESPQEAEHWEDVGGNLLRHPRGVLALLDENAEIVRDDPRRQEETLRRWLTTFSNLAQIEDAATLPRGELTTEEIFNRYSAIILHAWRRYCGLSAAIDATQSEFAAPDDEFHYLKILGNIDGLKELVRERLSSMDALRLNADFVATTMKSEELHDAAAFSRAGQSRASTEPTIEVTSSADTLVHLLSGDGTPMPFRVGVNSARVVNAVKQHRGDPWLTLSALSIGDAFAGPVDQADTLAQGDWYVAMGYVCGSLGAWNRTVEACRLASDTLGQSTTESALLHLKAHRRLYDDYDSLFEAHWAFYEPGKPRVGFRLRWLSERLYYECLLLLRSSEREHLRRLEKHRKRVSALIAKAWSETQRVAASPERCELANTLAYNMCELHRRGVSLPPPAGHPSYENFIADVFVRFVEDARAVYGEKLTNWPDNFVDTFGWVGLLGIEQRWKAALEQTRVSKENIETAFNLTSSRLYVGRIDQRDFQAHAKYAQGLLHA